MPDDEFIEIQKGHYQRSNAKQVAIDAYMEATSAFQEISVLGACPGIRIDLVFVGKMGSEGVLLGCILFECEFWAGGVRDG